MTSRVRRLTTLEQWVYSIFGWRGFTLPDTETVSCPKATAMVGGMTVEANWEPFAEQVIGRFDVHRLGSDGIASGTPMQTGTDYSRTLWWGGGYGTASQFRASIPKPTAGRYWVTGYPVPWFDRRCIIAAPNGDVCELIQFDQDAPYRAPGLPQQALGYGRWRDGVLVEGRTITASDLPGHMYVWGPGSAEAQHQQGLVVNDYVGGSDGSLTRGPVCGGWYAIDPTTAAFAAMWALGGECRARVTALATHGCRIIDRNAIGVTGTPPPPSLLTQAGTWTAGTNAHLFRVPLADLRRVIG